MTIFDEVGKKIVYKMEIWFEQRGTMYENGSKKDGSDTTREEDYVWNLYAVLLDGERASSVVVARAKEIMETVLEGGLG